MGCNKVNYLLLAKGAYHKICNAFYYRAYSIRIFKCSVKYETVKVDMHHTITNALIFSPFLNTKICFLKPSFPPPAKPQGKFPHFAFYYSIKVFLHLFRQKIACRAFLAFEEHKPLAGKLQWRYEHGSDTQIVYFLDNLVSHWLCSGARASLYFSRLTLSGVRF